jgi:hypothetical protein
VADEAVVVVQEAVDVAEGEETMITTIIEILTTTIRVDGPTTSHQLLPRRTCGEVEIDMEWSLAGMAKDQPFFLVNVFYTIDHTV